LRPAAIVLGWGLAWGLASTSGCGGTDDQICDVPTSEISVVAQVVDSGWDLRATIDFERGDRRGSGAPLHLCTTDELTINGQAVEGADKASQIEYSLSSDPEGERSFIFMLDRSAIGETLSVQVDLPPAFEILSPMGGDPLPLGNDLLLQWEPPLTDESMHVRLGEPLGGGTCVEGTDQKYKEAAGFQVPDTGQWTIPGADLASGGPEPCTLTTTLSRVVLGDYPDAFSPGGRLEARVERTIDLRAMP